jgi:hypothetical protein
MFYLIQCRQICLGTKLTISRSSFVKEFQLLNKIHSIDFNDIIENPKLAFSKPNIKNLLHHLKTSSRHVLAFGSSRAMQRKKVFNMIHFLGTPTLFFTLNLAYVHHFLVNLLSGKSINLNFVS